MTKVNEERRLEVQRKEAKEAQKRVEEEALRKERYEKYIILEAEKRVAQEAWKREQQETRRDHGRKWIQWFAGKGDIIHNLDVLEEEPVAPSIGYNRLFVSYNRKTSEFQVLRLYITDVKEAFDPVTCVSSEGYQEQPAPISCPVSWAHQFEEGKIPFLPVCPTCSKATCLTKLYVRSSYGGITSVGTTVHVECPNHYRWDPTTNLHSKWKPTAGWMQTLSGQWTPWDPKDPDGAMAARALKDKQIAETKAEIARLQAQVSALQR